MGHGCWVSGWPLPLQEEARLDRVWCRASLLYSSGHASPSLDSRVLPLHSGSCGRALPSCSAKTLSWGAVRPQQLSFDRLIKILFLPGGKKVPKFSSDRHTKILFLPGGKGIPFSLQYSTKISFQPILPSCWT